MEEEKKKRKKVFKKIIGIGVISIIFYYGYQCGSRKNKKILLTQEGQIKELNSLLKGEKRINSFLTYALGKNSRCL